MSERRSIYLLVFSSPIFPAHWAVWIPQGNDLNAQTGKILNAVGAPATGFVREVERAFRLDQVTGSTLRVLLSDQVEAQYVIDGDEDDIERTAYEIAPPEKSLKPVGISGPGRVEIKNCQTWLREFVLTLVHRGILSASAINALDQAPRN